MLTIIDSFLNRITMYRIVLYYLTILAIVGFVLSFFGLVPFGPTPFIFSFFVIFAVSMISNALFARIFKAARNLESVYITAFILVLIITPVSYTNIPGIWFLVWTSFLAMASKYIFAINKKHVFNPAALGVGVTVLAGLGSASWWVGGNIYLLPIVFLGGLLIVRKIQREDLVLAFIACAAASVVVTTLSYGDPLGSLEKAALHSPVFFFAFIMITEPLTTPPTRLLRIAYGALVGAIFAPAIHVGSIYSTPELALLIGNIFSYAVSPKGKYLLTLVEKKLIGTDTYDFTFASDMKVVFRPGQYLEWTLDDARPDDRGNRRYFTLASAPTEPYVHLGVKFYPESSSYKKLLLAMKPGDAIVGAQLSGEFVMPSDEKKKLVFIAGGIGITPFRSMVHFLLDTKSHRDITLLYSNKTYEEIAYKDLFDRAGGELGMKTVYTLTDIEKVPANWSGKTGMISADLIMKEVPDYKECMFYISGTHGMVTAFTKALKEMGVPARQIKTDFFPGFV
jgi:ferredoxin-NADP reductase